jgi:oxygen-independent coproporphyrinogen-3 oxidase
LIYGLPLQTVSSFSETLEMVLTVSPDRFSIFNYAHMPTKFKTQRQIDDAQIQTSEVKLEILQIIGNK